VRERELPLLMTRRSDVKVIASCMALLAIVSGCGAAHRVAKPTPPTSRATHVATSDTPTTVVASVTSEPHTCAGAKRHANVNAPDIRLLRRPVKLGDGQLLLYPIRDHDKPTVDATAALHPQDGAGNSYNPVYGGVAPVLVLVRFTNVISIANPEPVVDRLAWIVLSNCVLLTSNGPGADPPVTGYSITVVDATTGHALITEQEGRPLDVAQLSS